MAWHRYFFLHSLTHSCMLLLPSLQCFVSLLLVTSCTWFFNHALFIEFYFVFWKNLKQLGLSYKCFFHAWNFPATFSANIRVSLNLCLVKFRDKSTIIHKASFMWWIDQRLQFVNVFNLPTALFLYTLIHPIMVFNRTAHMSEILMVLISLCRSLFIIKRGDSLLIVGFAWGPWVTN